MAFPEGKALAIFQLYIILQRSIWVFSSFSNHLPDYRKNRKNPNALFGFNNIKKKYIKKFIA